MEQLGMDCPDSGSYFMGAFSHRTAVSAGGTTGGRS